MRKRFNNLSQRVLWALLCVCLGAFGLNAQIGPTGGTFTTCSGTFTDPGGAGNYGNGANVVYTIQPTNAGTDRTTVSFSTFSVENTWDYLIVHDGNSTAAPVLFSYSGTTVPAAVTATQGNTSGALTFNFTSDAFVTTPGWDATVSCTPTASAPTRGTLFNTAGTYTLASTGQISDPGGPSFNTANGAYQNNRNVVITVNPNTTANLVRVNFGTQFSTESGFDFVRVFDGTSTAAPLLGQFTGTTVPPTLTASLGNASGALTFQFTSDGSVTAAGFLGDLSLIARPFCNLVLPTPPNPIINSPGVCGFTVTNTSLDATLNGTDCNVATLRNNFTNTSTLNGATLPVGSTVVTWSVTTNGGLVLSGNVTYTVVDREAPKFTACPASPFVVNLGPGECNRVLNFDLSGTDNCGNGPLVQRIIEQNNMVISPPFTGIICGNNNSLDYLRRYTNNFGEDLRITSVDAGVESSPAGRVLTARIFTIPTASPFLNANLTLVATATFVVPTAVTTGALYNIPINARIPTGSGYVLAVTYPDDACVAGFSNSTVETSPTFVRGCNLGFLVEPTNIDNFGFTQTWSARINGVTGNLILVQNSPLGSGSTFPLGITPVSYTYRDASNNAVNCNFNVDVREFPNFTSALTCNDNLQISLDEDCSVAINADQVLEGGPYRCYDKYVVQLDRTAPFNNGPWLLGTVTAADINRTYGYRVFEDKNGNGALDPNENVCWGNIRVEDKLPPVLSCPTITVPCNTDVTPGTLFNLPAAFAFPSIQPPDGAAAGVNVTTTVALPAGAPVVDFSVKVTTNHTWVGDLRVRLTAPNGTTVTVFDRPGNPATACGCPGNGLDVLFTDNTNVPYTLFETTCGNNPAIAGTFQPFQTMAPLLVGNVNGTWTANISDNVGFDVGIVTVTLQFKVRTTFPLPNNLFVGQPGVTQSGGTYTVAAGLGTPPLDNCTAVTLTYIDSKVDIACPPVTALTGIVTRKWTARDASGNTSTCSQTINLDRPALADIVIPPDYDGVARPAFNCTAGVYPTPQWIQNQGLQGFPTFEAVPDGCSIGWTYEDAVVDVCDGTYKIRRKWVIVDWCTGNDLEVNQIVKVVDNAPPVFNCSVSAPPFTTVAAAAAAGWLEIRGDGPDGAYNCGSFAVPANAPDTFYILERAVAPLTGSVVRRIQCGALTTQPTSGFIEYCVNTDFNKCCATTDMPDVIVADGCSRIKRVSGMVTGRDPITNEVIGMFTVTGTPSDFPSNNWWTPDTLAKMGKTPCLPIGTHDVVYMAEDDCGNTVTCAFRLRVIDGTPPIVVADEFTQFAIGYNDNEDCYPGSPADSAAAKVNCKFSGVAWQPAKNFDDGSYDNCGPVKFTVRRMPKRFIGTGNNQVPVYSDFIESLNKEDGCIRCEMFDDLIFSTLPTNAFPAGSSQINTGFDPFGPTCIPGFAAWKPDEYQRAWLEQDSVKYYCDEVGTRDTVILRVYQLDEFGCPRLDKFNQRVFSEAMIAIDIVDKIRPTCIPPANVTISCENFDPTLWAYGQAQPADNCCLDLGKVYQGVKGITHSPNYSQFDTTCNKGTITRMFTAYDCHGNTQTCTQRVVAFYEEDYYVRFPDDRVVTICDTGGQYGAPTFFGEDCELLAVSFKDDTFTVVPDACFKVERKWKIINWCTYDPNCDLTHVPNPNPSNILNNSANLTGVVVSNIDGCSPATIGNPWRSSCVRINPGDLANTNYTTFWQQTAACWPTGRKFNGYTFTQIIKITDTKDPIPDCVKPDTCDLTDNDPLFWNVDYWWDPTHSSHDLCEMPIDLKLTATDACSGNNLNFRYLLFLDLDNNGTMETVISSSQLPPTNTVFFGNALNPNYQGGTARAFDHRPVINPTLDWYRFAIQVTRSGANATAAVRFNTVRQPNTFVLPQIPHGRHKIKWIVEDGCGNNTVCEYPFQIIDCKKPTVVCKPLSVNIMPTRMVTLWAADFLEYAFDNCTPADQLKIAVSAGDPPPAAFPRDPVTGLPITSVTFTCDQLGPNVVQIWAEDSRGNADFCQVVLLVQDNMGNCTQKSTVAGELKTEATQGVEEGNVKLAGTHVAFPPVELYQMSDNKGSYKFSNAIPLHGKMTVTPVKTDNPLNGVTTLDLALISKHILNIEPLNTPYRMIAADANKSGTITTFDVVELRKLILGIYDELPSNNSWRFVDKSYVFPNPTAPFAQPFPESKTVSDMVADQMAQHFVGVKIGDVNGSAVANNLMSADDRTSGTLLFDVEDREVKAGEVFEAKFKASEVAQGYQFTLNHSGLEVVDIVPGAEMGLDNFGVFAKDAAVTTSWNGDKTAQADFTVKFRALRDGKLSKLLAVSSRITKAEAYGNDMARQDVAFRFNNGGVSTISGVGFELYQNQPNPFIGKTMIGFHLPEATNATLNVYDESGKLVHRQEGSFTKGYNSFVLDRELMPTTGLLYYTVETSKDSATRKMIQSK